MAPVAKPRIGVPARCTHCGALFETKNLIGGTSPNIRLIGNFTNCPLCGGSAQILDGVYDMVDSKVQLVSGPPLTRALLEELQAVIEQSRARGDKPEETLRKVQEKAPWFFRLLTRDTFRDANVALGTIAAIVSAAVALKGTPSEADIRRWAREEAVAEQAIKTPKPDIPKELPGAKPEEHQSDTAKRIPNRQYKPEKYKRNYKHRAKRKH